MGGIDLEWIKPRVCFKESTQVHTVTVEWHVNWLEYVRGMCMSYYVM